MERFFYPRPQKGFFAILSWEFQRFLERVFPEGLYARALLIVIMPVLLLQVSVGYFFLERYYEQATKSLARSYVVDISHIISLYHCLPASYSREAFVRTVNARFGLGMEILDHKTLPPPIKQPLFSSVSLKLARYLEEEVSLPFWIDLTGFSPLIDVRILVKQSLLKAGDKEKPYCWLLENTPQPKESGFLVHKPSVFPVVFRFLTPIERVHASARPLFLLWMVGSSAVLLVIAFLFLRQQINPILRLAEAAEAFGMGKNVTDFKPGGSKEIRAAAQAFLTMKGRIEKQVEQRTLFLAGISHDLRTILTRLHLGLALLPEGKTIEDLKQDATYMQHILEHYMDFARSEVYEVSEDIKIATLFEEVLHKEKALGKKISLDVASSLSIKGRPALFRRALHNLVQNALKFADHVFLSARQEGESIQIIIEDDGPGIPEAYWSQVFEPFFKLDQARTLNAASVGLGLTIAKQAVKAHDGEISLGKSSHGGLRVLIVLPKR